MQRKVDLAYRSLILQLQPYDFPLLAAIDYKSLSLILAFTWFGLDIGGSLTKLVYFEPIDIPGGEDGPDASEIKKTISIIHRYLAGNTAYGKTGQCDAVLSIATTC